MQTINSIYLVLQTKQIQCCRLTVKVLEADIESMLLAIHNMRNCYSVPAIHIRPRRLYNTNLAPITVECNI